jgi:hypothetical protein
LIRVSGSSNWMYSELLWVKICLALEDSSSQRPWASVVSCSYLRCFGVSGVLIALVRPVDASTISVALRIVKKQLPAATHIVRELSYAKEESGGSSARSKRRQEAGSKAHGPGTARKRAESGAGALGKGKEALNLGEPSERPAWLQIYARLGVFLDGRETRSLFMRSGHERIRKQVGPRHPPPDNARAETLETAMPENHPLCHLLPTHVYSKELWEAHLACYAARVADPDLIQKGHRGLNLRPLPTPLKEMFGNYDPRKSVEYYLRFRMSEDPGVLLEFLKCHPLEFEYSGWVLSAFGYVLLGYAAADKSGALRLLHDFWRRRKHPIREWEKLYGLSRAIAERRKFATLPCSAHFRQAAGWLARNIDGTSENTDESFKVFKGAHPKACSCCVNATTFSDIATALKQSSERQENREQPQMSLVLDEYLAVVCGGPGLKSRTIKSWLPRKVVKRRSKRQNKRRA